MNRFSNPFPASCMPHFTFPNGPQIVGVPCRGRFRGGQPGCPHWVPSRGCCSNHAHRKVRGGRCQIWAPCSVGICYGVPKLPYASMSAILVYVRQHCKGLLILQFSLIHREQIPRSPECITTWGLQQYISKKYLFSHGIV